MISTICLTILFSSIFENAFAFNNGAPCSAQYTMTPSAIFHGVPQNPGPRPPPYQFSVTTVDGATVTKYKDEIYKIKLIGGVVPFRGFLIQARPASAEGYPIGHLRVGSFVPDLTWSSQGVKIQPCPSTFNDSITHVSNEDKTTLEVLWKPTRNYGPVLFVITVVQNRTLFWTQWLPSTGLLFPDESAKFSSESNQAFNVPKVPKVEEPGTPKPFFRHNMPVESTDGFLETTEPVPLELQTTTATQQTAKPETVEEPSSSKSEPKQVNLPSAASPASAERTQQPEVQISVTGTRQPSLKELEAKIRGSTTTSTSSTGVTEPVARGSQDSSVSPKTEAPAKPLTEASGPSTTEEGGFDGVEPAAPAGPLESSFPGKSAGSPDGALSSGTDVDESLDILLNKTGVEPNYCADEPCFNGATCISLTEEQRFDCQCTANWTGAQCSQPNNCFGNKCRNGARCISGDDDGYSCVCGKDWSGQYCERECPAYLCDNGGTCVVTPEGGYGCNCAPGWTGHKCREELNECNSVPCLNNATCIDKFNGFECICADGYMGETCHRPCQDIYKSCDFWGEQDRCDSQRASTKWFDINCAVTCGQCHHRNDTVLVDSPLPPVMEPFHWIIGKWNINTTSLHRFPVDFFSENASAGYYEELVFSVTEVPAFGPPAINFTSYAISNSDNSDVQTTVGFLTLKPATKPLRVFLMATGNEGITTVEEGVLNGTTIKFNAQYFAAMPRTDAYAPAIARREFTISKEFLRETVDRVGNNGKKDSFTKYYYKAETFASY